MDLLPGQDPIDQGIFFLGRTGDTVTRPKWALDGSFLAFRQLPQLVPEFDKCVLTCTLFLLLLANQIDT